MALCFILTVLIIHSCGTGIEQSGLVSTWTFKTPVLKGKKENPVLRVSVENKHPEITAKSLSIGLSGINTDDIKALRIYYTGSDSLFSDEHLFGQSTKAQQKTLIKGWETLAQLTFQAIDITEILSDIDNHVCASHTGPG